VLTNRHRASRPGSKPIACTTLQIKLEDAPKRLTLRYNCGRMAV